MGNDGVVYLKDATECTIENCTFRNIGKYAVCLSGGCANAVNGNDISHGAEGGVLLLKTAGNTISDNHIHDCGFVYKHIGGVVLEGAGTDDNQIAHNLIHDISRYGISLKNVGVRNRIECNRVLNTNLETYDTGGIEVTQQDRELRSGGIIHNNVVGDSLGYSANGPKPVFLSWSIYLDSFAGGYTVTNRALPGFQWLDKVYLCIRFRPKDARKPEVRARSWLTASLNLGFSGEKQRFPPQARLVSLDANSPLF